MPILDDVTQAVGNTPLVRINRIIDAAEGVTVAVKLEFQNPGASVKDRIGVAIIDAAEASGELKPGGTIVEAPPATPASRWPWSARPAATTSC
jgi:cysteine synthase A